ncbi:MAG TPA: M20/M25/M40 family metallo-hydrolase [Thermoanaerobaculia bacterium]|nr:M20/M25/M40 family metallo-hydrolase [Thermoanaerobaculia bacterium]
MIVRAVLAILMFASTLSAASPLSPAERAIVKSVDLRNDEGLALLERVVNINSGTHNLAGVREVGSVFRAELDSIGFKTRWVDQDEVKRGGHLVADHPGPGPRILLIGHLDTVFEPDSPFQKFEHIDARTARGPGIIDMKGGDVIIVQALKALHATGQLKSMNMIVVMTGDEEDVGQPMSKAREALVAAAKGADFAIGFEDGDGDPAHGIVARRGTTQWQLTVTGATGHSSQIFSEPFGNGAIFEAARILNTIREKLAGQPHLTFNPAAIVGGTTVEMDTAQARGSAFGKTNVIPARVIVTGDLRGLTMEQFRTAEETMRAAAATSTGPTHAEIAFEEGYPPLAPTAGNSALLARYDRASQDLGFGPVTAVSPDKAGAADVAFVAGEVPSVIDAVGLKGHDDHSPGETADLTTLSMQTKRAAILLSRIARGDR